MFWVWEGEASGKANPAPSDSKQRWHGGEYRVPQLGQGSLNPVTKTLQASTPSFQGELQAGS